MERMRQFSANDMPCAKKYAGGRWGSTTVYAGYWCYQVRTAIMSWMTWRGLPVVLPLLLVTLSVAAPVARSQDSPETRDMPEALPDIPEGAETPVSSDPGQETTATQEPSVEESEPRVGLRLEAQLLLALSFPFGGRESGSAFGFGITYGAGWGEIPIMIGLDFMSVGRSNSATSRATTAGDAEASAVTRASADRLLDFDLWLRVQPPRWPIRPYAEGFIGAKFVRTHWTITSREETTSSGGDSEWTSAIGWGVGVDFMGLFNAISTFSLTLGMRRFHGSQIELERPIVTDGRAVVSNRQVAANETMFMAGLCGRYDFEVAN